MSKILYNLNGKQQLVEVGPGGGITSDAEILFDERLHGSMPYIELGKMEAYDELEDVLDHNNNPQYHPEYDENNEIVRDENGDIVYSLNKVQRLVRKLRVLADVIPAHAAKVASEDQARINAEARAYLASTDWLIVRMSETGIPVPQEVLGARAAARASVVE